MSVDVLLLSLGTTRGWRVADELFLAQLERAGASTAAVGVRFGGAGRLRRGYPVNDLVEMHAARRTLRAALREHEPRALVVSTTTAAMLLPELAIPYAVRLDAPASLNRPGERNALLRTLERRALRRARLVLPWSEAARAALPPDAAPAVVLPPPVEPSHDGAAPGPISRGDPSPVDPPAASGTPPARLPSAAGRARERLAVSYVPDPKAKGLELVVAGWAAANVEDARLAIYGLDPAWARAHLERVGQPVPPNVEWAGMTTPTEFRAALRRARVYVGGARWEDFGQAPLEALADGALLATVPSGGPFAALDLARRLDPRLVAPTLDGAALAEPLRAAFALDEPAVAGYRERATELLSAFAPGAIQQRVEQDVLPALLR